MKYLFLILLFGTTACSSLNKPFLWKLEKDGKTSYILGTIHYGVPYSNLPSSVTDKITTAKVVYVETDMDADEEAIIESEKKKEEVLMRRDDRDEPLSKILRPEVYDFVVKTLQSKYPKAIESLSPRGIAVLMAHETQVEKKVYVSKYEHQQLNTLWGMDLNITKKAKSDGKFVGVLDTDSYWYSKKYRVCATRAAVMVIDRIYRGEKITFSYEEYAKLLKMIDYYKAGEEKPFVDFYATFNDESDMKCLLEERNIEWIPEIVNSHYNNAPVFYAVGLAHMIMEPNSLQTLLKEKGFKIERIEQK